MSFSFFHHNLMNPALYGKTLAYATLVTCKIFNNSYNLDIGQSDWRVAQTESTGANTAVSWWEAPHLLCRIAVRILETLQGIRTHLNQLQPLEGKHFQEWAATQDNYLGKEASSLPGEWSLEIGLFFCLMWPLPNL